jgi:hypothetical protein
MREHHLGDSRHQKRIDDASDEYEDKESTQAGLACFIVMAIRAPNLPLMGLPPLMNGF